MGFLFLKALILIISPVCCNVEFSYIATFVYKHKFPVAPVCSGVVITEKLVLSAAYPIATMPRNYYCALLGHPKLTKVSFDMLEESCIGIKHEYLASNWTASANALNLAVVELEQTILFTWSIATARIPFPTHLEDFTHELECFSPSWKYRDAITGPGFPLEKVATSIERISVSITIEPVRYGIARISPAVLVCPAHIGLPVICSCAVIGVFASESLKGTMPCKITDKLTFTYTLSPEAHAFLNATVPFNFEQYDVPNVEDD